MDDLIEAYEVQEKEFMEREQYLLAKLKDCEQVDKVVSTCITEVTHIVKTCPIGRLELPVSPAVNSCLKPYRWLKWLISGFIFTTDQS